MTIHFWASLSIMGLSLQLNSLKVTPQLSPMPLGHPSQMRHLVCITTSLCPKPRILHREDEDLA